jgi:APA family basic amino acid/polyamine antiporter
MQNLHPLFLLKDQHMPMLTEQWEKFCLGHGLVSHSGVCHGQYGSFVSWSGYFTKFLKIFGVHLPAYLTSDPASYTGSGFSMNLPAFILVLLITALLVKGTKEAAGANNLIVLIKTSAVIFVIIAGAYIIFSNTDLYNAVDGVKNWKPFIPDQVPIKNSEGDMVSAYGIKGIISGAAAIFFAYIGFDAVSTQAGEAINPKKMYRLQLLLHY